MRADDPYKKLSSVIRQARQNISQKVMPGALCLRLINGDGPTQLQRLINGLAPEDRDHAIANIYTLLLDQRRRRELGAYFTPPHLVNHLLSRLQQFGLDIRKHRIHDPAAGGAAFIVPIARRLVIHLKAEGFSDENILSDLRGRLSGMEIDRGLAVVANALVRRMLRGEFGLKLEREFSLISQGNSLKSEDDEKVDAIIGNPPYGKVGAEGNKQWREKFSDIAGGQLNLYSMFVRQGLDRLKPGGLLGFIVPMSFIGGPEFSLFRKRITEMADVLAIDLIEKRVDVFLDVVQDATIVVLQRKFDAPKSIVPTCAMVQADASIKNLGVPIVTNDGKPWRLPSTGLLEGGFRLSDYGYTATVGHLVANRQSDRLRKKKNKGDWPLIWAKAITSNGKFDHKRGLEHTDKIWVTAPENAPYIIRKACVVLQRTSNRKQKRRLNAAAIPKSFIKRHGGVVGENHVIFLIAGEKPRITPQRLAILMNSDSVNRRFESMSGTVSVSAKLLGEIDLPDPALLGNMNRSNAEYVIATAYAKSFFGQQVKQSSSPNDITEPTMQNRGAKGEESLGSVKRLYKAGRETGGAGYMQSSKLYALCGTFNQIR